MNLSKRLSAIRNFVPINSIVADIGTDHGYIPASLIENNISKKVIATDVSKGSLEKTVELVKKLNMGNDIETRLGDGLDVIEPFEVDTLIIAGMGGILIKDILEKHKKTSQSIDNFILQPMIGSKELRKYLTENNFIILDEDLVFEEGKYYEIIFAKRGKSIIKKDIYYEISEILIKRKNPLIKDFVGFKIQKVEKIIEEIENIKTRKSKAKHKKLEKLLRDYREVIIQIES